VSPTIRQPADPPRNMVAKIHQFFKKSKFVYHHPDVHL